MSAVESAEQLNMFLEKINMLCEKLMDEDCPVCDLKLTNEKVTCANGHGICQSCKLVVNVCPECNSTYPGDEGTLRGTVGVHPPSKRPRQSNGAENVEDAVVNGIRCSNNIRGCQVSLEVSELAAHEAVCTFRLYTCKICSVPICLRKIRGHCERSHAIKTIKNDVFCIVTRNDIETGGRIYFFLQAHNEIFWFWRNNLDNLVHFGLQYCGDAERTKEFKYSLEVVAMNQKSVLKFRGPVLFDTTEMPQYTPSDEFIMMGKNLIGVDSKFKVTVSKA